jgi:hypothetical protein
MPLVTLGVQAGVLPSTESVMPHVTLNGTGSLLE